MIDLPLAPSLAAKYVAVVRARLLGGPGSGNFGHAGIPGQQGGSAPSDGSDSSSQGIVKGTPEFKAVNDYVDGVFMETAQQHFRSGKKVNELDDETYHQVRALDRAIAQSTNHESMTVYRAVPPEVAAEMTSARLGYYVSDQGYISTSKDPEIKSVLEEDDVAAPNFVTLAIHIPRAHPALDVNKTIGNHLYSHQREVILPRGTLFIVTGPNRLSVVRNG